MVTRPFRFSLADIFGYTTAVAIGIWVVVWEKWSVSDRVVVSVWSVAVLLALGFSRARGRFGWISCAICGGVSTCASATVIRLWVTKRFPPGVLSWFEEMLLPIIIPTILAVVAGAITAAAYSLVFDFLLGLRQSGSGSAAEPSRRMWRLRAASWLAILSLAVGSLAWHWSQWREYARLLGSAHVQCVTFSPDGQTLFSGDEAGDVVAWELLSRRIVSRHKIDLVIGVHHLSVSPDGKHLAIASLYDHRISIRERTTWDEIAALDLGKEVDDHPRFCRFSADGKSLYVGVMKVGKETLLIWDTSTWKVRASLSVDVELCSNAAISHDERMFATARVASKETPLDVIVELWDVETGVKTQSFSGAYSRSALQFSPDNAWLVLGTSMWNCRTGEKREFSALTEQMPSSALSPDGKFLAVGEGELVRLWPGHSSVWLTRVPIVWTLLPTQYRSRLSLCDVETGHRYATSTDVDGAVVAEITPNGGIIADRHDREIRLWRVPNRRP